MNKSHTEVFHSHCSGLIFDAMLARQCDSEGQASVVVQGSDEHERMAQEAIAVFFGIVRGVQGNRGHGSRMSPADTRLVLAGVARKVLEIVEGT